MHSASEILQQDIEEITIEGCEEGGGKKKPRQYHHMEILPKSIRHFH